MRYVQKMNQKLFEQLDAMEKDMDDALKYIDKLNKKLNKRLKELDW